MDKKELDNFMKWFVELHGNRQVHSRRTDRVLKRIMNSGDDARNELSRRWKWDDRKVSSLYAWQIKDKDK